MVKPTRYYSSMQEKKVAKFVGGKLCANSGAAKFTAGDVRTNNAIYECKTVTKEVKSYSVKKEVLDKIKKEAFETGKEFSIMVFNFKPDGEMFYIIPEKQFKWLMENYTNNCED